MILEIKSNSSFTLDAQHNGFPISKQILHFTLQLFLYKYDIPIIAQPDKHEHHGSYVESSNPTEVATH